MTEEEILWVLRNQPPREASPAFKAEAMRRFHELHRRRRERPRRLLAAGVALVFGALAVLGAKNVYDRHAAPAIAHQQRPRAPLPAPKHATGGAPPQTVSVRAALPSPAARAPQQPQVRTPSSPEAVASATPIDDNASVQDLLARAHSLSADADRLASGMDDPETTADRGPTRLVSRNAPQQRPHRHSPPAGPPMY